MTLFVPAYQPLFDRVLDFAAGERFADELRQARTDYFTLTGEVFDDQPSCEARLQAFLDWYIFDRPLAPFGEPPVRAFLHEAALAEEDRHAFRLLGRTVHGLFAFRRSREESVSLENVLTGATYEAVLGVPADGWQAGDLFEGRLVPWSGRLYVSGALIFHPRGATERIEDEVRRRARGRDSEGIQSFLWLLSRMAGRLERYRKLGVETVYDFERPPPPIPATRLRSMNFPAPIARGRGAGKGESA